MFAGIVIGVIGTLALVVLAWIWVLSEKNETDEERTLREIRDYAQL